MATSQVIFNLLTRAATMPMTDKQIMKADASSDAVTYSVTAMYLAIGALKASLTEGNASGIGMIIRQLEVAIAPRFVAGCRNFTATEALAHWGPAVRSQPAYVATIEKWMAENAPVA